MMEGYERARFRTSETVSVDVVIAPIALAHLFSDATLHRSSLFKNRCSHALEYRIRAIDASL